ncbi:TPA: type I restriction enzyme endonuclease domain-containing protein [Escherichia coli]
MAKFSKPLQCNTLDEVDGYKNEIAFYGAIKTAFLKHSTVDTKRSDELRNSALRQILNNAIVADGVDDIFKTVGLGKVRISRSFLPKLTR